MKKTRIANAKVIQRDYDALIKDNLWRSASADVFVPMILATRKDADCDKLAQHVLDQWGT